MLACLQAPVMYSVKVKVFKVFYFGDDEHNYHVKNITGSRILLV
jgi:hypothetical protein